MTTGERYQFFVTVHARPDDAAPGSDVPLDAGTVRALVVARDRIGETTFACSFEQALARLGALARLYCEPDGSFVWTSPADEAPWQVDGNLYDRQGRLLFVDLKGSCPRAAFDALLTALGWPDTRLMFQLTREAVFLDEAELRRFAAAD